jgi:hypothetical protein
VTIDELGALGLILGVKLIELLKPLADVQIGPACRPTRHAAGELRGRYAPPPGRL